MSPAKKTKVVNVHGSEKLNAETRAVLRIFPSFLKDIKRAEQEYRRGEYVTLEELKLLLRQ